MILTQKLIFFEIETRILSILKEKTMEYKKVIPIFKYIGGKTWLKNHLRKSIEAVLKNKKHIDTYVEPFAGGLGAFLSVYDTLINMGIKNIVINDINKKLIDFYVVVNNQSEDLISEYLKLELDFEKTIPENARQLNISKHKEQLKPLMSKADDFYKSIRDKFNKETNSVKSSACLLFLQKHCFNGIYRENSKGEYNTPFNWEPKVFTNGEVNERVNDLKEVFSRFNINFSSKSFESLDYNKNTIYYLDPPYANDEMIENKYNKIGFGMNEQKKLISLLKDMKFVYSNHYNQELLNEFDKFGCHYLLQKISRKNIISASAEGRKIDKIEMFLETID